MSVVDNEWKLFRPSTAGRRLRVSNDTQVLSAPLPFVNTQEDVFSPGSECDCGCGVFVCVGICFSFTVFNHKQFMSLMATGGGGKI